MSFTAVYTEFKALDVEEGKRLNRPPRIIEYDGWRDEDWSSVPNMEASTLRDLAIVTEDEDYSEYPKREWKVLKGFKTWKITEGVGSDEKVRDAFEDDRTSILGLEYNIERCGIPYGGIDGGWKSLFVAISEYIEPFATYHSPYEHDFADVTDFRDGEESVYYIEVVNGEVYVEEQTFRRTDIEKLVEERDRVADHEFSYPE